jgi:SSS family solute:Na+ symporter
MTPDISSSLQIGLAIGALIYILAMFALGVWAQFKVKDAEDYVVAGRRLPFSIAWMTLLATWFAGETMLTTGDEVRREGLQRIAMDPLGAGTCLILAGLFVAGPMWRLQIMTVSDFFRIKYGVAAELLSAFILIPSYFGWIAAQFVAMAEVLDLSFGLDVNYGILIVALIGLSFTLMGGMWSVTITEAAQLVFIFIGLAVLGWAALSHFGDGDPIAGWHGFWERIPEDKRRVIPSKSGAVIAAWLGAFSVGALGNMPGQDLMQRVFTAKSARVASAACVMAGGMYIILGMLPVLLGLAAGMLLDDDVPMAVPALAYHLLHPAMAVTFLLAIMSAVFSTIDSAILSPAAILSQNVFSKVRFGMPLLRLNRLAVVGVTLASLAMAYMGQSAYELVQQAYEMTLVSLFVPMIAGLYTRPRSGWPALACMVAGASIWLVHAVLAWDHLFGPRLEAAGFFVPTSIGATAMGALAYWITHIVTTRLSKPNPHDKSE